MTTKEREEVRADAIKILRKLRGWCFHATHDAGRQTRVTLFAYDPSRKQVVNASGAFCNATGWKFDSKRGAIVVEVMFGDERRKVAGQLAITINKMVDIDEVTCRPGDLRVRRDPVARVR